jgi:hypothetical protein
VDNKKKCQKLIQILSFPTAFITISIIQKSEDKLAPTLRLTFVCFHKVGLLYSRVGTGAAAGARAASKYFYLEPEPHKNDASPQHCIFMSQCVKFSGKKEMITCYHDTMITLS